MQRDKGGRKWLARTKDANSDERGADRQSLERAINQSPALVDYAFISIELTTAERDLKTLRCFPQQRQEKAEGNLCLPHAPPASQLNVD